VFGGSLKEPDNEKIILLADDKSDLVNYISPNLTSIGTDTTRMLLNHLSGFELSIEHAQIPRINKLLIRHPNICTANRVKNEQRLQENIFSLPLNIYSGLRLYYISDKKIEDKMNQFSSVLFNDKGQLISLALLFKVFPKQMLGISKGRSYGGVIDQQLLNVEQKNLISRAGQKRYSAMASMLFKNRFDFLIDFPVEVKKRLDASKQKISLKSLEIAGSPEHIIGYVACSKSELGQRFIAQVNQTLKKLYQDYDFYFAHIRYLNDSDVVNFNHAYQSLLNTPVPIKPSLSQMDSKNVHK
jgi:uncharacterized protein (TIGR02285 family)